VDGHVFAAGATSDGTSLRTLIEDVCPSQLTILSFTPPSGRAEVTNVHILGTGFDGTTDVTFNGVSARFQILSSTEVRARVPFGATTGPIRLSTPRAS